MVIGTSCMHPLSFKSRGEEGGGILRLVCCIIAIDLGANRIRDWCMDRRHIRTSTRFFEPPVFSKLSLLGIVSTPYVHYKPDVGSHRPFLVLPPKKKKKIGTFQRYTVEHTV